MTELQLVFRRLRGQSPPMPKSPLIGIGLALATLAFAPSLGVHREWSARVPDVTSPSEGTNWTASATTTVGMVGGRSEYICSTGATATTSLTAVSQ